MTPHNYDNKFTSPSAPSTLVDCQSDSSRSNPFDCLSDNELKNTCNNNTRSV